MALDADYRFLQFIINKEQGAFFPYPELDMVVDRAQMSYYNDEYIKFGASQRLNDALSPFKREFQFTNASSPTGLILLPDAYQNLLSVHTVVQDARTGLPRNRPVPILNEDEKVARDNSQIYAPSLWDPYAMIAQNWDIQLYPKVPMAGTVFYLTRPPAPLYAYNIVSGRVPVYDPVNSVQLGWAEKDVDSILIKALSYLGINVSEQAIVQYAEQKSAQNLNSPDKI